ncbi:MAG: hypothetical protein AAGH90_10690 [Pseudomonadota bacterium]
MSSAEKLEGPVAAHAAELRARGVTLADIDDAVFTLERIAKRYPTHDFGPLFKRLDEETIRLEEIEQRRQRRLQRAMDRMAAKRTSSPPPAP